MSSKKAAEVIRPLLSRNKQEARTNALRLYKLWFRFIPFIKHVQLIHFPPTVDEMRQKLRDEYAKHKNVSDLRTIDMLIHKSRCDLREVGAMFAQECHIVGTFFNATTKPPPAKFLDKFYSSPE